MTEEPTTQLINAAKHFKIQSLLGKNTPSHFNRIKSSSVSYQERNGALADLNGAKHRLQETKNEKNNATFAYLGRLAKYEQNIPTEAFEYAIKSGCYFRCESSKLGVYSVIDDYTNSKGIVFKAHYTIYGHFLRQVEPNEAPISYSGHFLIKSFVEYFEPIEGKSSYETLEDFIRLKCDGIVEDAVVETEDVVVETVETEKSKDLSPRFTQMWNLHSRKTNKQLYELCWANGIQVNKTGLKKHDFISKLANHGSDLPNPPTFE